LHLEVSCLTRSFVVVFDECILQTVARLLISNNFTAQDLAKSAEDELQVFISCHGIQLTDEQDVLRRLHFGKGQISHHFKGESLRLGLAITTPPL
jgi:DnaJ-domain-containing protein 1